MLAPTEYTQRLTREDAMKLATWNCHRRFDTNNGQVAGERPALAVVQECIDPKHVPAVASQRLDWLDCYDPTRNKRRDPSNGIGVLSWTGLTATRYEGYCDGIRCALPLRITGEQTFNVLAVWNKKMPSQVNDLCGYVHMLERMLEVYDTFIREPNTVILGDFNTSAAYEWEQRHKRLTHNGIVEYLRELKLVSAYHAARGLSQHGGEEPTHRNNDPRARVLHIDYCFIPQDWVGRLESATLAAFGASDHTPLVVELSDPDRTSI